MADWWMSDGEIASDYRLAKDPILQVKILAQLNDATLEEIGEKMVSIGAMTESEAKIAIHTIREFDKKKMITPTMEKHCMELYESGYSDGAIAEMVDTTRICVLRWRKRNNLLPNNPARTLDGRWYSNGKKKKHKSEVER